MMLLDFIDYLQANTSLSEKSVNHYESGFRVISKMMYEKNSIEKPLEEMTIPELEFAIFLILQDEDFQKKDLIGKRMYSNSLKYYQSFAKSTKEYVAKEIEEQVRKNSLLPETEKEIIIRARIGQGKFRDSLIKKYSGQCVVTGSDDVRLLVASHIKPWSVSNNSERIDVENGLLLTPLYDKMFDLGLITFTDEGQMKLSSTVKKNNQLKLQIDINRLYALKATATMKSNLDYHRDVIFLR